MRNTFGDLVSLTVFGESHGSKIGGVLDGLPSGIKINIPFVNKLLLLRQGEKEVSTARCEEDTVEFLSGIKSGKTTGTPIGFTINNKDVNSDSYKKTQFTPRPSHSDFAAFMRYGESGDYLGGGHFSGRLTAVLTVAGGILLPVLEQKGIKIATHISEIYGIKDRDFDDFQKDFKSCLKPFPVLSKKAGEEMKAAILSAASQGDSLGGTLLTAVIGMPIGIGEPFFDSLESVISHLAFSIPAVKGIEFGGGFSLSSKKGSQANDQMYYEKGDVRFSSNNSGGILGGLSSGQAVTFKTVIKPTPTISKPQTTVNLKTKETKTVEFSGRHDPSIVPRAAIVQTAVTALGTVDLLAKRFGTDWLKV